MTDTNVLLGRRLRQIRDQRGMTQAELAARVYISRNAIAQVETGRSGMSFEVLQRVARVLEVSIDDLTGGGPVGPTAVERQLEFVKGAVKAVAGVPIRFYGDVPISSDCWRSRVGEVGTLPVPSEWLGNLSPEAFFVIRASDDGLAARGILRGHYVLCLRSATPRDGDIILARVGQTVTLHEWRRTPNGRVMLHNAVGTMPVTLDDARDGIEIEGVAVRHWSDELRPLR